MLVWKVCDLADTLQIADTVEHAGDCNEGLTHERYLTISAVATREQSREATKPEEGRLNTSAHDTCRPPAPESNADFTVTT